MIIKTWQERTVACAAQRHHDFYTCMMQAEIDEFRSALAAKLVPMTDMQRQLNEAQVAAFGAQSAASHLGSLVDFERQVSDRAMQIMKALMDAAQPINNANQDCEIPASAYREFVDANAELLFVKKNGHRPEPTSIKQEPTDWAAS